jgi:hypothetical protein
LTKFISGTKVKRVTAAARRAAGVLKSSPGDRSTDRTAGAQAAFALPVAATSHNLAPLVQNAFHIEESRTRTVRKYIIYDPERWITRLVDR